MKSITLTTIALLFPAIASSQSIRGATSSSSKPQAQQAGPLAF
jgi:hypothetical protein